MATVSELLSYQGNAGLGLGSNADIPLSPDKPLEFVNTVLRDVAARDAQKNLLKYQQQINDRDKLYDALASGAVKVGDILERDMPVMQKALDEQTKAFQDWMKKGYGDPQGAMAYKRATQAANDVATQAQARKLGNDREMMVISKEGIPRFAEERKKNLGKNLDSFWSDWNPYQETNRLNVDPIEKFSQQLSEAFTDPKQPLYKGKRDYFSYDDTLKNATKYSLEPEGLYNLQVFHDTLSGMQPVELMDKVKGINTELQRYNTERGLKEGDKDYANPIQLVQLPNGKMGINEPLDKLAAKFSLAGQEKFKTEALELDKDKFALQKQAEEVRQAKAREAIQRGGLALDWAKFNYAKEEDQFGANAVLNEAKDIISKGEETVLDGGKKVLRIGDPTLLKQFGNIDKEGNVTNVPDAIEYDRDKDQVKLVYYDEEKTASGKNVISKTVSLDQRTWLKEISKRSFPNKDLGKVNTLIDDILTQSGNSLYKLTQGGTPVNNTEAYKSDKTPTNWKDNGNGTYTYIPTGQVINSKTGKVVK